MRKIQRQYEGFLITGSAVGDEPPYRCAGRAEGRFPGGSTLWDQHFPPSGQYDTEEKAAKAGLEAAKLWIHTEMRPGQQEEER